jgi:hypothetical protein
MAELVWTNAKLWLDGYDLSGSMNAIALEHSAELVDNTAFGDATRSRLGGLKNITMQADGYWNGGADQVDDVLFSRVGQTQIPVTLGPIAGADGEVGYGFLAAQGAYAPGGALGEMLAFTVNAEADGDLVRGTIMHNAARTASGNGVARQLGAAAAGQNLYAALHVIAASGTTPTLDVVVESDDGVGMASSSTRITFAQATAIGAQWATPVAGAITDDWWRITYNIGGTGPSFTFVVLIGIQ